MTSIQLVQNEISRFLSTDAPEVLSISGEWGVGKTFTWQTMLGDAANTGTLKVDRHSYVSLFGINSLEALKLVNIGDKPGHDVGAKTSQLRLI